MKKMTRFFIVCAVCVVLFSQESFGQQGKHIYVGYGTGTVNDISNDIEDIIVETATGGKVTTANSKYTGAIFAGYRGYITSRLELGGTFIFERASRDVLSEGAKIGSIATNSYSALAELKYNYINKARFRLHSGIGAGLSHSRVSTEDNARTEKDKMYDFAYQVDALGASYGDQFSISVNAGFGYKGIFNAVLAYGF